VLPPPTLARLLAERAIYKISSFQNIRSARLSLALPKAQSAAMAKAKLSLRAATENAVKANKGFVAVSVTPSLKDGHPVAEVTLAKGEEFKTAAEKLD
jgi:hypothetical protein